ALRRLCSAAKERMLGPDPPERIAVTVLGAGRSLVGESISTELTEEDLRRTMDDFLPPAAVSRPSTSRDRRAGLRELGLPYATDPAVTRHLAAFLSRSAASLPDEHRALVSVDGTTIVRPDLILFNGGFFTPELARARMVLALTAWFGEAPRVLM